jgi:hypothetical protein
LASAVQTAIFISNVHIPQPLIALVLYESLYQSQHGNIKRDIPLSEAAIDDRTTGSQTTCGCVTHGRPVVPQQASQENQAMAVVGFPRRVATPRSGLPSAVHVAVNCVILSSFAASDRLLSLWQKLLPCCDWKRDSYSTGAILRLAGDVNNLYQ